MWMSGWWLQVCSTVVVEHVVELDVFYLNSMLHNCILKWFRLEALCHLSILATSIIILKNNFKYLVSMRRKFITNL